MIPFQLFFMNDSFSNYQHELPFYRLVFKVLDSFGEGSPKREGMDFGQLLGHGNGMVAAHDLHHLL